MPALSLVMPCYNRAHDLSRVLEAYDRQEGDEPFELIAVDDASRDATVAVLQGFAPRRFALRVERLPVNSGPATARNRGLELVDSPLVAFVGDDIAPAADFVAGHVRAHTAHPQPEVAILGRVEWPANMPRNTLMEHIDGVGAQQFSYHYFQDGHEYDYRHLYTANVSLKRDFLHTHAARFDTDFPHAAFEDAELAFRLAQHGLRILYDASIVGYHYHYYTIWTFSQRQYRCGQMAGIFARKHPRLAPDLRITKTRLLVLLAALHTVDRVRPGQRDQAAWIERRALDLASAYEWAPHALLDGLYLGILDYYWQRGLIDAVFRSPEVARRVRDAHAAAALGPLLRSFLERAPAHGVAVPWPGVQRLRQELRAAEPLLMRSALFNRILPAWGRWLYQRFWYTPLSAT